MDPDLAREVLRTHKPRLWVRLAAGLGGLAAACSRCGEPHPCPYRRQAAAALANHNPGTPEPWRYPR